MKILKHLLKTFLDNDIIFIIFIALVFFGVAFQYSAAKAMEPWALSHAVKALAFFPILFVIQYLKTSTLFRYAYIIYIVNEKQQVLRAVTETQLVDAVSEKGWQISLADVF